MASRKFFHARPNYIYPSSDIPDNTTSSDNNQFEFDESDVWNTNVGPSPTDSKKTIPGFRSSKKPMAGKKVDRDRSAAVGPASLPVSVPDWSKILKDEYRDHRRRDSDDDGADSDDNGDVEDRIPPHEYLARTRGASLSVHEGVGRTLKGRDLRRVRNAIWKKVGFED